MSKRYRPFSILLALAMSAVFTFAVHARHSFDTNITLRHPIELSAEERAFVRSLPQLKVSAYQHIPPLSFYDQQAAEYQGISVDTFRFIAKQIGLSYQIVDDDGFYVDKKLEQFESGEVDVLLPVSYIFERADLGLFTDTHYKGFYSVIARKKDQVRISDIRQLNQYRVGIINKAAAAPYVRMLVDNVRMFDFSEGVLYDALRNNKIDLAIFNQGVFAQDRYRFELFDLDDIYTLYEYPRSYGFLFTKTENNQRLVHIFNRYIEVMDNSQSVRSYADGEQRFIEKYIQQKSRQQLLWVTIIVGTLMFMVLFILYRSRQRILVKLAESHERIVQQHQTLQEANRQLEYLSQTDALTGLANRRHFDQRMAIEYSHHKRNGTALSVLMIDIDFFKSINDHYGHAVGDTYLYDIATVLTVVLTRSIDFAARYGGEEFVCVLPSTDLPGALHIAEKIRLAVIALNLDNAEAQPRPLTVSVGVATLQGAHCKAQQLIAQADQQLYRAKNSGRNRVCGILLDQHAQCCEAEAEAAMQLT